MKAVGARARRQMARPSLVSVAWLVVVSLCAAALPLVLADGALGLPGGLTRAAAPEICSGGSLSSSWPANGHDSRRYVRVHVPANAVIEAEVSGFLKPTGAWGHGNIFAGVADLDDVVLSGWNGWTVNHPNIAGGNWAAMDQELGRSWQNGGNARDVVVFAYTSAGGWLLGGADYFLEIKVLVGGSEVSGDCDDLDEPDESLGVPESQGLAADPVNTATGNFLEHRVDLAAPAGVYGLEWSRTYNSMDFASPEDPSLGRVGVLGRGWVTPLDTSLRAQGSALVLRGPDGRRVRFPASGGGWSVPAGMFATVSCDTGTGVCTLVFNGGETWVFDNVGRLVSMADGMGNSVAVDRGATTTTMTSSSPAGTGYMVTLADPGADGRIDSATGPDGAVVSYAYSSTTGLLESVTSARLTGQQSGTDTFSYDPDTGLLDGIDTMVKAGSPALRRVALTYDDRLRVETRRRRVGT